MSRPPRGGLDTGGCRERPSREGCCGECERSGKDRARFGRCQGYLGEGDTATGDKKKAYYVGRQAVDRLPKATKTRGGECSVLVLDSVRVAHVSGKTLGRNAGEIVIFLR